MCYCCVMVVQAVGALGILGGHASRIGITSASLKAGAGQFAQSLPFGAGYSLGTYLGFPKNYQSKVTGGTRGKTYILDVSKQNKKMRGKWYSFKRTRYYWKATYHRKMRRTVYTHPKRRF